MSSKIKIPQRLKGFQDFFAKDMMIRQFVIDTFRSVYEKYGYEPLETPALEYSELILGQSGEEAEKQYYRFTDNGGRDVMLKFEVMTAMCRAVAQNINNLPMPYKRYQIQPVWRAENVQKGRYREFTQCDADTIGSSSMMADAEFIQMGLEIVEKLGFKEYVARISNRKFLEGLAEFVGIPKENFYGFCMSIDKLEKIGKNAVVEEMVGDRQIERQKAEKAIEMLNLEKYTNLTFIETINAFRTSVGTTDIGKEGLDEIDQIREYLENTGVKPELYKFDISIARGLAHYTGPVWEFTVLEGGVGSIAGCGRYDNLIGEYLGFPVPATGGSFGIERLCDIIKDRKMFEFGETTIDVLVTIFSDELKYYSLKVADSLRKKGIKTMLYPESSKLEKQLKFADKKGIRYVLIIAENEIQKNVVTLKDLKNGKQNTYAIDQIIDIIKS